MDREGAARLTLTSSTSLSGRFRPSPLLPGGHLQTIGGFLLRSFLRWPFPTEDVVVSGGEGIRLLVRASWQPESHRPALLLVHGLEGCDASSYVISTGALAFRSGLHVVRMNMRGCGDSLELCPRLYNAGLSGDLVDVCRWLAGRVSRFAIAGFSLGANLSLLTLVRERSSLPDELSAAVAVSPPLDMSVCADALEQPSNRIYHSRFLQSLLASYRRRQRLAPALYEAGRERGVRSVREFDDVITAFYGGYDDDEHYYRSVSPGPLLGEIDRPTLVLASGNDPFIPEPSVSKFSGSAAIQLEIPNSGGHVGFVGRTRAPGSFWAAERILSFLSEVPVIAPEP